MIHIVIVVPQKIQKKVQDKISPDIISVGNQHSFKFSLPSISTDINLGFQSAPKSTPRFGLYRVSRGIIF